MISVGEDTPLIKRVEENANRKLMEIKTYKYRWVILLLHGSLMASHASMFTSLYNIANIMLDYYGITNFQLVLGSTINGVVTIVLLLPAGFVPPRYGLRFTVVIGSGALAIGAATFVVAIYQDGYYAFVLGLAVTGVNAALLPQLIPEVAAVWFPLHEQTLATNTGYLMQAIGLGISYVETMVLFNNHKSFSKDNLHQRIKLYMYLQSFPCIITFFLSLVFFKDKPKLPPTIAKLRQREDGKMSFTEVIYICLKLTKNPNYILLVLMFAFNYTVGNMFPIFLNSLFSSRYSNVDDKVGELGVVFIVVGVLSTIVFSSIFDKKKQYKCQLLIHYILAVPLSVMFAISLIKVQPFATVAVILSILWMVYSPTIGFIVEMTAEIVYPVNINIPIVFSLFLGNILTIIATQLAGWLIDHHIDHIVLWMAVAFIALQFFLLLGVTVENKRSNSDL